MILEGILLLVSTIWITVAHIDLAAHLVLSKKALVAGLIGGCSTAANGFFMMWFGRRVQLEPPGIAKLDEIVRNELALLFREFNPMDILLVAAASGFCEEVFFRGVLQNQFNLFFAGIIFGFFHCPDVRYLSYGIFAAVAGLFFGWLYQYTGNLWAPIIAHSLSNLIVISIIRYGLKPHQKD